MSAEEVVAAGDAGESFDLPRPSLAWVVNAAKRAEAAARALAATLRDRLALPELDELIDLMLDVAASEAELCVVAEIERMEAKTPLPVIDLVVMPPHLLAHAKTLPEPERLKFALDWLKIFHDEARAAFEKRKAELDYYFAVRKRESWEQALEDLTDLGRRLMPTQDRSSAKFKSFGEGSSLDAILKFRALAAALRAGEKAGDLVVTAVPADAAIWFCERLHRYERGAPIDKLSFGAVTGLERGRRWHTVEKQARAHATIKLANALASGVDLSAELNRLKRSPAGAPNYSPRHRRRIVNEPRRKRAEKD